MLLWHAAAYCSPFAVNVMLNLSNMTYFTYSHISTPWRGWKMRANPCIFHQLYGVDICKQVKQVNIEVQYLNLTKRNWQMHNWIFAMWWSWIGQDRRREIQLEVTIRSVPDHAKRYHSSQLRLVYENHSRLITRTTFVKLSDGMLNLLDRCSNFIGAGVPLAPRKTVLVNWTVVNRWLVVGREEALARSSLFEASPLRSGPEFTTRGTS